MLRNFDFKELKVLVEFFLNYCDFSLTRELRFFLLVQKLNIMSINFCKCKYTE